MNKVCVYAIAKDESQFVDRWAKSVSPADKVIVLDTGSTDDTVEKLKKYDIDVYETHYEHFRFDEARNNCLDLIPDEYNIRVSIDMDEVFASDDWADILRSRWDENNPRVIYSYVWAHNEGGSNGLEFYINKIHGTDPYLRWEGAVHEHLIDIRTGRRDFDNFIDLTQEITVHHYPDLSRNRMFYKELAKERIQEHPDDYQAIILLGNEERVKGDPHEAIKWYEHVAKDFPDKMDTTEKAALYYALGNSYKMVGRAVDAMLAYTEGIAINKFYRDNYYGLGVLMFENQMFDMAKGILEEALKTTKRYYFWMEDNYTWTYAIYDILGCVYDRLGDKDKALACAARALSFEPTNKNLIKNYSVYLNS